MAYALRMQRVESYTSAFKTLDELALKGIFDRPLAPLLAGEKYATGIDFL